MEITSKGKGKGRWYILFNDLLIRCNMSNTLKKKSMRKASGGSGIAFEYMNQLALEHTDVVNVGDEGEKKHGFQVLHTFLPNFKYSNTRNCSTKH